MPFCFIRFWKLNTVKWDPLLSTHCRRRSRKLSITQRVISCGMAVISWRIESLSCSIDWGRLLYTFPQRKKSHGCKSGETYKCVGSFCLTLYIRKWNYQKNYLITSYMYIYSNVYKQLTDVKLLFLRRNTWKHLNVRKRWVQFHLCELSTKCV